MLRDFLTRRPPPTPWAQAPPPARAERGLRPVAPPPARAERGLRPVANPPAPQRRQGTPWGGRVVRRADPLRLGERTQAEPTGLSDAPTVASGATQPYAYLGPREVHATPSAGREVSAAAAWGTAPRPTASDQRRHESVCGPAAVEECRKHAVRLALPPRAVLLAGDASVPRRPTAERTAPPPPSQPPAAPTTMRAPVPVPPRGAKERTCSAGCSSNCRFRAAGDG